MSLNDPIHFYNGLVESHQSRIADIFGEFSSLCEKEKLTFGGRSMYLFLRPNFITTAQYRTIRSVCGTLRNAITKFKNAALTNPDFMAQAGLIDRERALVDIDPGYDRLSITARWDSFMTETAWKFVELNAECPAGIAYSDVAAKAFDTLPFVQDFKKKYRVLNFKIRQALLDGLLDTYAKWRGNKRTKKPQIAIVDWRDVPTYTEFQLFEEFFASKGFKTVIADPRDLTYENGRLRCGAFDIDLVYKRILTNDCVEKPDETKALVSAYRDKNVCMINPFRAKLVHKKSIFAVLTHEKNRSLFNRMELEIIQRHIPWTRVLNRETTMFQNTKIDLAEYVASHKDRFVIKPNDEYGGKGVYLGKETDDQQWNKVIQEALSGEPYVVQEIIDLPRQSFPVVKDGRLAYADMVVDMDPYAFGPNVEGLLTRLSASSLANVTAGGGTTPTFVIESKQRTKRSTVTVKKLKTKSKAMKTRKRTKRR